MGVKIVQICVTSFINDLLDYFWANFNSFDSLLCQILELTGWQLYDRITTELKAAVKKLP